MSKLAGKVAVVTGSSSGIGQAIAIRLASEGANIVVDYRSHPEGAADTAAKIAATGSKSITVQADVSKLTDTQNLVDQAYAQLGRCDTRQKTVWTEEENWLPLRKNIKSNTISAGKLLSPPKNRNWHT